MRRAHALRENANTETPTRFLFVDTETTGRDIGNETQEQVFRLGAAFYWERNRDRTTRRAEWYDLDDSSQLWLLIDELSVPHQRLVVFAHNIQFDLQVLDWSASLRAHGWQVRKAIIDSPRFILRAQRDRCGLLFLDWYNYFRGSLAYAGDLLGVPKLPMPQSEDSDEVWRVYCRNDVLVLFQAVKRYVEFIERYDLGAFAYTLAGQSLNAYRHRFMQAPIYIHNRKDAIEIERRSYSGGRTEMFFQGTLPPDEYTYVDVNSMYASVMHDELYPNKLLSVIDSPSVERLEKLCQEYAVIADVFVQVGSPLFPLRTDSRLLFPVGGSYTTLPSAELRLALARGCVKSVGKCAVYSQAPLFQTWIKEIYALRAEAKASGDDMWNELLKRLMNSLFGKFGQANDTWKLITENEEGPDRIWMEHDLDTMVNRTYRRLTGRLEQLVGKQEAYNSFVSVAASVTSAARILLLKYIEQAGFPNVFYCDTDSLIVNAEGLRRLQPYLSETQLGLLKVEGTSREVRLLAPKHYTFGEITRHKGRRKDAQELGDGRYKQIQFVSMVGALRKGWNGGPLIRYIVKRDALTYRKGTVLHDGRIEPLVIAPVHPDAPEVETDY